MRRFLRNAAIAIAGLAAVSCSTVNNQITDVIFVPNPNSDKRNNAVVLELAYSSNRPCDPRPTAKTNKCDQGKASSETIAEVVAGPAFGAVADFAGNLIKDALADEAMRYTADFSASASGSQFYHFPFALAVNEGELRDDAAGNYAGTFVEESNVKFAGFKLERQLDPESPDSRKADKEPEKKVAMRICAIAVPAIGDEFISIIPVSYSYRYSKAKLLGFSLLSPFGVDILNPWEIVTKPLSGEGFDMFPADRDLDVTMNVNFEHLYYGAESVLQTTATPEQAFRLPAVRVSGEEIGGYFPDYREFLDMKKRDATFPVAEFELPCDDNASAQRIADLRDRFMSKVALDDADRMKLEAGAKPFQAARRAFNEKKSGNAFFTLNVRVTEVDDYGSRMTTINEKLKDKEGKGVIDALQDMLPAQ